MNADNSRSHCTLDNCGHMRQLDAIVDLLEMHRGGVSVIDFLRARMVESSAETSRLMLLVDELTAQRDAFGQKAHHLATVRDDRQRAVVQWAGDTFGPDSLTPTERATRVLEEVVELAQAEGVPRERALAVLDHVYGKAPGDPAQEVGGIGVTLLAYCAVREISADAEEVREIARVLAIDPAHFRARHNAKADAGIAVPAPEGIPRWSPGNVLHLKTQRDQPYGSVRTCCERCGIALAPPEPLPWTASESLYNNPPGGFVNCEQEKRNDGDRLPTP